MDTTSTPTRHVSATALRLKTKDAARSERIAARLARRGAEPMAADGRRFGPWPPIDPRDEAGMGAL